MHASSTVAYTHVQKVKKPMLECQLLRCACFVIGFLWNCLNKLKTVGCISSLFHSMEFDGIWWYLMEFVCSCQQCLSLCSLIAKTLSSKNAFQRIMPDAFRKFISFTWQNMELTGAIALQTIDLSRFCHLNYSYLSKISRNIYCKSTMYHFT